MGYVESVLQPNERILMRGRLHWIIYWRVILWLVLGVLCAVFWTSPVLAVIAALFGAVALIEFVHAWFIRWITEIAVTNRRVIYKRGFINRHTVEINTDKVESVDVNQSVPGRLLNYGSLDVKGTGHGFEPLHWIEAPLALRSAIIMHDAPVAQQQKA